MATKEITIDMQMKETFKRLEKKASKAITKKKKINGKQR